MMFDLDRFIADCRLALAADQSHKSAREVVARAVCDPGSVLKGLGEPRRAEVQKLYHSEDLTILNAIWGPRMTIMPHNHEMWAVIGVYTGREDNIFWRRIPGSENGKVEAAGARALCEKDAEPLGRNIIHSVTNPISRLTGAIHTALRCRKEHAAVRGSQCCLCKRQGIGDVFILLHPLTAGYGTEPKCREPLVMSAPE